VQSSWLPSRHSTDHFRSLIVIAHVHRVFGQGRSTYE